MSGFVSTGPLTKLHYAANGSLSGGTYAPGNFGFNLADVSSVDELNALPAGVKGLVWLGMENGADAAFQNAVQPFIGNPNLYGFYLTDEPDSATVPAANLMAELDYIHAHVPGAITFIVLLNQGDDLQPVFGYNPANTHIDLFGVDPYPVQTQYNGANYPIIGASVTAAEASGIPLGAIVPTYQAFGGGGFSSWIVPTAAQEQSILSTWGALVPTPAFDYAYSWGSQSGDTALVSDPVLQQVFAAHNAATACYAAGTRIATESGEVAVEHLAVGARVLSAFGGAAPVTWIGHRTIDCSRHPRPQEVWPIRIRAGAFGDGLPSRDLRLSPDHAVYLDERLIPVRYLVNGATIVQEPVARISYFHVELPAHDVILAENLPAESYLDTGNRAAFANGGTEIMLHPDLALQVWHTRSCAKLLVGGQRLTQVRRAVLERAMALGYGMDADPALRVQAACVFLPVERDGAAWRVRPPAGTSELRLVSRNWIAAHSIAEGTDPRVLGVALANIRVDGKLIALDDRRLASGWHDPEPGWRWSDGCGRLLLDGARCVEFDLAVTGQYWVAAERRRAAIA